ncbi:MAG: type II secretion system GspH family protein [bacterium]|nr:type II secretion system GspH family protein [bacterium]
MKYLKNRNGFTLVELMLYIVLISGLLITLSVFVSLMLSARIKSRTVSDVEASGRIAIEQIEQSLRNATAVASPTPGNSSASLSLTTTTPGNNPTIYDLSSGTIRVNEGAGSPIDLTDPNTIEVTNLSFENVARAGTPDIIRITFTVSFDSGSSRNEYKYTKDFYGTAGRRD